MVTITWLIEAMDVVPQAPEGNDYVVIAYWRCNAVDGDYRGTTYGAAGFPIVLQPDFTPYSDLTEAQVLGWCWANGVDQAATEAIVTQQVENQINPPVVSLPLPWSV